MMERIETPQELIHKFDFTLDSLCPGCPLRSRWEGFDPAYGVLVDETETGVEIEVTSLEADYTNQRGLSAIHATTIAELKTEPVDRAVVQEEFEACEEPVKLQRRVRPDEIVCAALNRLMPERVPDRRNLRVTSVQ